MSWASSEASRRIMQANRRRDTGPELAVRRLLHARGLRFRVDLAAQPGVRSRPDIVFTRRRIAVYIDGCFWHGCPRHRTQPKANADYWTPKLQRNVERDAAVTLALQDAGWTVLRFWEHEDPQVVATTIAAAVEAADVGKPRRGAASSKSATRA
ncbi:very short patch repair endonuclease [Agrococcus versicolor]